MGPYEIIYADFPWPYTSFGTAKISYDLMTEQEISEFDWSQYMAKRCIVFSWVTGPKLAIAMRCGEEWRKRHGLHYQGIPYIWVKTKKDGTPIQAAGPRPRLVKPLDEFVLAFSTTPQCRTFPLETESQVQHFFEHDPEWDAYLNSEYVLEPKQTLHSRKPDKVRDNIVELLGDRPRIELFAREATPGWDLHGNQAPK